MARKAGTVKTYPRVTELLKEAVAEKGQKTVESETGINQSAISRYLNGIGEPTQATLEKLARYFRVSVAHLRGEDKELAATVAALVLSRLEKDGLTITDKIIRTVKKDVQSLDTATLELVFPNEAVAIKSLATSFKSILTLPETYDLWSITLSNLECMFTAALGNNIKLTTEDSQFFVLNAKMFLKFADLHFNKFKKDQLQDVKNLANSILARYDLSGGS